MKIRLQMKALFITLCIASMHGFGQTDQSSVSAVANQSCNAVIDLNTWN